MSFAVTINSVDRTTSVVFPSLRKRDNLNQQVDTLEFTVRKYGSLTYTPTIGHEVVVTRNGSTIFGGVIVRITETTEAAGNIINYRIECSDFSQYLKRKLVTERYTNTSIDDIIADLVTNYTVDGFTTAGVDGAMIIRSISFNRLTVADCLQKLADAVSYVWYVDYDKDIHFFPKNTELAPFDITDTSANYIKDSLEIREDLTQIRNNVLVQGGEVTSSTTRTEEFNGDGTRAIFALANKFSSAPTVTVGGVGQTVGLEFIDDDTLFDCMWNFNEKYVRFTAGNIPAAGTNNVDVTGYYKYPIAATVPSTASQEVYGEYGYAITDKSIASQAEAIERAYAELKSFQNTLNEGSFRTYTDGLRSGQVINITSSIRARDIDVVIQSVTAVMRDPNGDSLEYTVTFATLKSIGIIEYLQNQLRSNEVIVDDLETLLNFFPLTDSVGMSDSLAAPTDSTGPYVWDTATWGYATWS